MPESILNKNLSEIEQIDIDSITANILDGKKRKTGEPLAPKTVETLLRNFRQLVKWCVEGGRMQGNLFVKAYKAPQAAPKMYTEDELRILSTPPKTPAHSNFFDLRNYTIVMFLMETGVRRTSLINIRICDVDLRNNQVQIVRSKNKSVYCVRITNVVANLLQKYIFFRTNGQTDVVETDVLFCDQYQRPITQDGINTILKKYVESRGVKYRGIHAFRHSCATMMVKNGATVAEVAQQTGHKDLRQVEGYVHAVQSMPQDKIDKLSPLARFM